MSTRILRREGYTLIGGTDSKGESFYTVEDEAGNVIGTVGTYKVTMERRTPGRRYVNARWTATRWWAQRKNCPINLGRFESAREAVDYIERIP